MPGAPLACQKKITTEGCQGPKLKTEDLFQEPRTRTLFCWFCQGTKPKTSQVLMVLPGPETQNSGLPGALLACQTKNPVLPGLPTDETPGFNGFARARNSKLRVARSPAGLPDQEPGYPRPRRLGGSRAGGKPKPSKSRTRTWFCWFYQGAKLKTDVKFKVLPVLPRPETQN